MSRTIDGANDLPADLMPVGAVFQHFTDAFPVLEADMAQRFAASVQPHVAYRRLDPSARAAAELLPTGIEATHTMSREAIKRVRGAGTGATVLITTTTDYVLVAVSAESAELLSQLLAEIEHRAVPMPRDEGAAAMTQWHSHHQRGAVRTVRHVPTPPWNAIRHNYPTPVRDHLNRLMRLEPPADAGGGLLLFHGPPGTGKTTALRSLLGEWKAWCDGAYIADPDRLFNDPGYLLDVMGDRPSSLAEKERWKLIVAEDCDQHLHASRRIGAGADLGRVLNVADGVLGQGQHALLLFTTNEDVARLHPALTRPGRCIANVEFTAFEPIEAAARLGHPPAPGSDLTLASLLEEHGELNRIGATLADPRPGMYL